MNDLTLLFCFFCESSSRRKYLDYCLQSILHSSDNNKGLNILVIDGSSSDNHIKNQKLFSNFTNCRIIHDTEINPIVRISNHIDSIQTKFTIKLLEDCLFLDFDWVDTLGVDILLLNAEKTNCVVQYPTWPEDQVYACADEILCQNSPKKYELSNENGLKYYDRITERIHHNYLCNNVLYKTKFLQKHIHHYARICSTHSAAESDRFDRLFSKKVFSVNLVSKLIKIIHKIIFKNNLIGKTFISETYSNGAVIHIGYESTEEAYFDNPDRKIVSEDSSIVTGSVLESIQNISHLLHPSHLKVRIENGKRKYRFDHNID